MASILQTDLLDLVNQWEERVAFNEGFRKQKISAASGAGRDAFSSGLSRSQGQDAYFQSRQQMNSEAAEFLAGDSAAEGVDVEQFSRDYDDAVEMEIDRYMGPAVDLENDSVLDGEETLGMESCVSGETEGVGDWYSEAMQDHAEAVEFDLQRRGWL